MTAERLDRIAVELDEILATADAALAQQTAPGQPARQPVHTLYLPADRLTATGMETIRQLRDEALDSVRRHAPAAVTVAQAVGWPEDLVAEVWPRVLKKLEREPVEDFRIDLEDGYGSRPDDEEDEHARAAAAVFVEFATRSDPACDELTPPFSFGVRIKSLEPPTRLRALRSFDLVVGTLAASGGVPSGFVVTLPKVTSADQVRAFVHACAALESAYDLPVGCLRFEVQVETPQAILGPDGTATVAALLAAVDGRCSGLHYGTYDYSASLGIAAAYQSMEHPAADHAKAVMQVAAAASGVWVSDGSTNMLPLGETSVVHERWALHARLVRRSLERGFYQGWDLHPAQLPTRYLATYAFYREGYPVAASRLKAYSSGVAAGVLDEPATAFALASFLLRGVDCGALDLEEVMFAAGLNSSELSRHARRPVEDDPRMGAFNALPLADVRRLLLSVCASSKWADAVAAERPFATESDAQAAALRALAALEESDLDEALAGHPRIGERAKGEEGEASRREQAGVEGADSRVLEELASGNRDYEERFGHVYLVRASGRSAEEMLTRLKWRLSNDAAAERAVVRNELGEINALRLERLLAELGESE